MKQTKKVVAQVSGGDATTVTPTYYGIAGLSGGSQVTMMDLL